MLRNHIDAKTRLCAVLGCPIRHSASPAMQNAGFEALGLNWRYVALEVEPAGLPAAIEGARRMGFIGLNLTVPHKIAGLGLVDVVDENARRWGAINTIRFEGASGQDWKPLAALENTPAETRSHGFNTDVEAISRAIREDLEMEIAGAKILLLGAGGAGRAAGLKLAAEGAAELFLVNRTRRKAEMLLEEIMKFFPSVKVSVGYPKGAVDLVLNATSLGLKAEDSLPMDLDQFSLASASRVFDMVYRPVRTKFLISAEAKGCRVANGLSMLLYQGAAALELWTGQPAPLAEMRAALEKEVYV